MMKLLFVVPLAACLLLPPAPARAADRPNFVIILCDDLGYGDLGCFGHPHIKTPNLDRLARQGMRLTSCYSSAPVCSPSRVGLLTGRTPSRAGVYDWIPNGHVAHMRRSEVTVATLLKKAGYATCQAGKWHCNGQFNRRTQPQPGDHGFDHWFSTQNNAHPSHRNPDNFVRDGKRVGRIEGYSCQIVTSEAIGWLKKRKDKEKPFFLHVCFHETHEPVASPPELVKKYLGVAKNEYQAEYFANVANVDLAVGRILEALDDQKLADDTLVFFTSDNGPETLHRYPNALRCYGSPGKFRGMKLWLYEGGIHVPGILRWPGKIEPGQVSDVPVCSLDVLPTFCELAGAEIPKGRLLDGTSFVPLLSGKEFARKKPLYWDYYAALGKPKAAMRVGDWMVLGHRSGPEVPLGRNVNPKSMKVIKSARLGPFELYNLRDDPEQKVDLAARRPEKLAELSRLLIERHREVQKEGPVWTFPMPKK
jgi:arylsulfatase A